MSALRDLGNEHFKAGAYKEAEQLYTEAIHSHSRSDPKVFANRSLTRIRLNDWPGAESDARKSLELYASPPFTSGKGAVAPPAAMKAHYYLAQALIAQRHVSEALTEGMTAYRMCLDNGDSSAELLSQFVLRAKQAQWQAKETGRLRELNADLRVIEELLEGRLQEDLKELQTRLADGELGQTGFEEERRILEKEAEDRRKRVRQGMSAEGKPEMQERNVPDHLIDSITFEIMHDPVITPSGASYERVGLLKHLRATGLDPLTREALSEKQLYPNVALRNACSDFLENNGWAVDY
ncbi:uncharacterized protein HMPREF1541_00218 [Cyphellophora europaea CBS 101466]|uniref:U-box domain-containing protein n=1 Tax=Cyphellophora europaea (strain CBS 101466) TaxID=1220924 RepID=W2SBP9_CYPE1|nr:uncharacterized protein HMPREF1541_00218 [Cyphellophora europaea CBS 101466]ETN46035.1 hypothetical protein HMPREF1541_00218 [Cyphellophora europaea CBS 101466]